VAASLEHDTEKWNIALGIDLGRGLRARATWLDLRHPSLGVGWFHSL
jgi:hypothetical protein